MKIFTVFYHVWARRPYWSCELDRATTFLFPLPPSAVYMKFGYNWPSYYYYFFLRYLKFSYYDSPESKPIDWSWLLLATFLYSLKQIHIPYLVKNLYNFSIKSYILECFLYMTLSRNRSRSTEGNRLKQTWMVVHGQLVEPAVCLSDLYDVFLLDIVRETRQNLRTMICRSQWPPNSMRPLIV